MIFHDPEVDALRQKVRDLEQENEALRDTPFGDRTSRTARAPSEQRRAGPEEGLVIACWDERRRPISRQQHMRMLLVLGFLASLALAIAGARAGWAALG